MIHSPENQLNDNALSSWKDIARYLSRGVRTVQRWEAELGLPVRRTEGKKRGGVMALRPEIDDWLKACPVSAREQVLNAGSSLDFSADEDPDLPVRGCSQLILESRLVRRDLGRTRRELTEAVSRFAESCRHLEPQNEH